ncbi:hypothetical protein F2Q70_00015749 [Brassica cretica]|uniref:MATH domain-containing protein n=1 Tax=Brassica cretica TaxID=69181 RepID=A0A8S9HTS4_BRACR|nr:hypothetical protein F2Q70_00015749 [Brassica cretica]
MCSSEKTDEFRGNIIAVGEPLGDFTKFRGNSDELAVGVGIPSEFPRVLKLYPKGYSREDDKWLSVFLHLADNGAPKADEKIFVQANLRVLDPHGSNHKAYQMNTWQIGKNLGWGWDEFLSLEELRKAYLDKEDALNVEAEFEVVSATKYSPII